MTGYQCGKFQIDLIPMETVDDRVPRRLGTIVANFK